MKIVMKLLPCIIFALLTVETFSEALSQRKIYTLFLTRKTWNEAKAICESQQSQLLKLKSQRQYEELSYLDKTEWRNHVMIEFQASSGLWSPLHLPFANTTWTYQDCEPHLMTVSGPTGKCSTYQDTFINSTLCDEEHIFICERIEGDCWFEPFYEKAPRVFEAATAITITGANLEAKTCAMECRDLYDTSQDNECWGFTFHPTEHLCLLRVNNTPTASSDYLYRENREYGELNSTFYVRRCFEGVMDTNTYDTFYNKNSEPETACAETPYTVKDSVTNVCYCSIQEKPPIPEPTTSELKAKRLVEKLTINVSFISTTKRKLTSAEDNRPTAIGVGYLGVGILTCVFGSLILLDLNTMLAGLKNFICRSANDPQV